MDKERKRKKSDPEALARVAREATAAGMTYGQYQQKYMTGTMEESRQRLKDSQPVYVPLTDTYQCPVCGTELALYRNCSKCEKVIIWRKGGKI